MCRNTKTGALLHWFEVVNFGGVRTIESEVYAAGIQFIPEPETLTELEAEDEEQERFRKGAE